MEENEEKDTEKYLYSRLKNIKKSSSDVSLSFQLYFSFPLFFKIDLKLDVISIKLIENLWCVFVPPPLTQNLWAEKEKERERERNPTYQKAWSLNDRYSFIQGKHFMQHTHSQTKEIWREIGRREKYWEESEISGTNPSNDAISNHAILLWIPNPIPLSFLSFLSLNFFHFLYVRIKEDKVYIKMVNDDDEDDEVQVTSNDTFFSLFSSSSFFPSPQFNDTSQKFPTGALCAVCDIQFIHSQIW